MDCLIRSIARSGPWSGNVANSMRASIAGGSDESTTAIFVPPMSTPIQTLPASFSIVDSPGERNRRSATVGTVRIESRTHGNRCSSRNSNAGSVDSAQAEPASASSRVSERVSSAPAWMALPLDAPWPLPEPLQELSPESWLRSWMEPLPQASPEPLPQALPELLPQALPELLQQAWPEVWLAA